MKRRGVILAEVLVSIAIFALGSGAIICSYLIAKKAYEKQEEYLYFESICYDIDAYGDKYKRQWDVYYFGLDSASDGGEYYYDSDYKITSDTNAKYKLTYEYNVSCELLVSIYNNLKSYFVIENLNYGGARYATA